MQYQQNTGGLPVPADGVNQAAMVPMQSLPFSPPAVVPIQPALPTTQQYAPFITGATVLEIQQQAGKNPLRAFYFNLVSSNGWNTPEFIQLVQEVAFLAEFFMVAKGMQVEQAVQQAASEATLHSLAQVAARYVNSGLGRYINDALADNLNTAMARSQQWQNEKRQFHQHLMQQQNQMGMGYGMGGQMPMMGQQQMGGYGMGQQMGGYGPRQTYATMPQRGGPPMQSVPNRGTGIFSAGGQSTQGGGAQQGPVGGGMRPRKRNDTNQMLTMEPGGQRKLEVWNSRDEASMGEVNRAHGRSSTPVQGPAGAFQFRPIDQMPTIQPEPEPETWPKLVNPERPYEGMIFEDGTEVRPAKTSGWTRTFNEEDPYPIVYDPTTHFLFHIKRPDGTVIERLEPRTEDMDYEKHELNRTLREQARERREHNEPEVVPLQWGLAERIRTSKKGFGHVPAEEETGPDTSKDVANQEAVALEEVVQVHSRKEAELKVAMYARSSEVPSGTPVEMQFDIVTPVLTDRNLNSQMRTLAAANTFEELQAKLYELEDTLSDELKEVIDSRLTAAINQALQQNIGLDGWKIDSFKDYPDLIEAMKEDYSQGLVDHFNEYAVQIIEVALQTLSDEDLAVYLKALSEKEGAETTMVVFRERCSTTQVPWNFNDLHLDLNKGGRIPQDTMPELYSAMQAIFSRTEDFPVTFAHRYIQTADKKVIELRQGYLANDALLLFEAK